MRNPGIPQGFDSPLSPAGCDGAMGKMQSWSGCYSRWRKAGKELAGKMERSKKEKKKDPDNSGKNRGGKIRRTRRGQRREVRNREAVLDLEFFI